MQGWFETARTRRFALAVFLSSAAIVPAPALADEPAPTVRSWSSGVHLGTPEAAYFAPEVGAIFVSGHGRRGGWVQKLRPDGTSFSTSWASGLHHPKGLRSDARRLWVADGDSLVALELASGAVSQRLKIAGAKDLTDVEIADDGRFYATDAAVNVIFSVELNGRTRRVAEGAWLLGPQALTLNSDGDLIVAAGGSAAHAAGEVYVLSVATGLKRILNRTPVGRVSGIVRAAGSGLYVAEGDRGRILQINNDGSVATVATGLTSPARLGAVPGANLLIVPETFAERVSALAIAKGFVTH